MFDILNIQIVQLSLVTWPSTISSSFIKFLANHITLIPEGTEHGLEIEPILLSHCFWLLFTLETLKIYTFFNSDDDSMQKRLPFGSPAASESIGIYLPTLEIRPIAFKHKDIVFWVTFNCAIISWVLPSFSNFDHILRFSFFFDIHAGLWNYYKYCQNKRYKLWLLLDNNK